MPIEPDPLDTVFIVLMANHLIGAGRHRLELGFGPLLGTSPDPFYDFIPRIAVTGTVGYRYLPGPGGWGLRVGLAPIYDGTRWLLRPGLSLVLGASAEQE